MRICRLRSLSILTSERRNKPSGTAVSARQSTSMRAPVSYYQEVLDKISHADHRTFRKELRKAFKRLLPEEREELKRWFRTACVCRPALTAVGRKP